MIIYEIIKKINKTNLTNFGEVLMGFALLFFGLDLLKNAIPGINAENAGFLVTLNNGSYLSILAYYSVKDDFNPAIRLKINLSTDVT